MGAGRGATRYDTSQATRKYAATPRDAAVGLDHMGARFYAPELGMFTSGDPAALTSPERLVTADFAAANPYAYAKQSPVLHADHDGHFWHVAIGAAIGALVGGGLEAAHQYLEHGKVESWGRVGAAASGGAVSGALTALNPAAGLAAAMTDGAAIGVISGGTQRLVESGGKSAGTLGDVVLDAAAGAVTAGVAKGAGALVKKVAPRVVAAVRGLTRSASKEAPFVYRQGTFADRGNGWGGNFIKGRQWATENPLATPDFAEQYGLPNENSAKPDWVVGGKVHGEYSTRSAPASHNAPANGGGALEVLPDDPQKVVLAWFHMPD